jgi:hypothetical protein
MNNIPVVSHPIVDRLAFILRFGSSLSCDHETLLAPVVRKIKKGIELGVCERAYLKGTRYHHNFKIHLPGGSSPLVQIGALLPEYQNGGIRVVLNPARFEPGDAKFFNKIMRNIVGNGYFDLMENPLINNVDFAVDVWGALLDRMLVTYKNAQRYTVIAKRINAKGHIEGYNFGSVSSDYMSVVYDKGRERNHAALLRLIKNGAKIEDLKSNLIKQFPTGNTDQPRVRVEVRGKKMRGMPLYKLDTLPNRFERFQFCDLDSDGIDLPPYIEKAFLALCRQNGVKAGLENFKRTEWIRKVNAYYRAREASWWRPEQLWQESCNAIREIGLFPDLAFEEPKFRGGD